MTPVISPWVFYLMPVCENIGFISAIVGFISAFGLLILIGYLCGNYDYYDEDEISRFKRLIKLLTAITIIFVLLACLIPNEETITKMIITQNVTYERVEVVSDTVANVYNDIMSLFQEGGASNG